MKLNAIHLPSFFPNKAILVHRPLLDRQTMNNLGVVGVMLTVEFLEVTVNTVSKAAMRRGMNNFIFVMYSNALAASILFLVSSIYHRRRPPPPLTCSIVGELSVVGFSSWSLQMLKLYGIGYSSPTLASAMSDLVPAFTFILAILCRMENLDFKTNSTWAKSLGTLISISGALTVTLYKGAPLISHITHKSFPQLLSSSQSDWMFGALLLVGQNLILSSKHIYQTHLIRKYPAELMAMLIPCTVVTILSVSASLISEKGPEAWRLGLNTELIAIGCAAFFGLCIRSVSHIWAMKLEGPVFVAMFKPFEIVIAVIMGMTFLGDTLYLGSMIGAVIIVVGFYAVIWGKAKEKRVEQQDILIHSSQPSSPEVPLLQNKTVKA